MSGSVKTTDVKSKRGSASVVIIYMAIICMLVTIVLPFVWGTEARVSAPYETAVLEVGPLSFSTDIFFVELFLLFAEGILLAIYFMIFYFSGLRTIVQS